MYRVHFNQAQRLASLLEEALAAEEAAHTSADGLAARLRATNDDADRLYASAKECLEANDDDGARKNLEAKNALLARVPALEAEMEQANGRLSSSRRSAEVLKAKIAEVDAIVRRAAASAAAQGGGGEGSAFVAEDYDSYVEPPPGRSADPLLARFEALEREGRKKV
jgi:phage shock protein A